MKRLKIITDMEHLTKPCEAISFKDSLAVAKQMKMFLLTNKNIERDTIGLACNQLGLPGRVILYRDGGSFKHLINPQITYQSDDVITTKEGCLSVPNKSVYVTRSKDITIYSEINGPKYKEYGYGWESNYSEIYSLIIQHEIDHLNGITLIQKEGK